MQWPSQFLWMCLVSRYGPHMLSPLLLRWTHSGPIILCFLITSIILKCSWSCVCFPLQIFVGILVEKKNPSLSNHPLPPIWSCRSFPTVISALINYMYLSVSHTALALICKMNKMISKMLPALIFSYAKNFRFYILIFYLNSPEPKTFTNISWNTSIWFLSRWSTFGDSLCLISTVSSHLCWGSQSPSPQPPPIVSGSLTYPCHLQFPCTPSFYSHKMQGFPGL